MIDFSNNKRQADLSEIKVKSKDGKLYIWGSSHTAKYVSDYIFDNIGVEVYSYITDDEYYDKTVFNGKPVLKASEWKKSNNSGDILVLGYTDETRAEKQLAQLGNELSVYYFVFPYFSMHYGEDLTEEYYKQHESEYRRAYDLLSDDISRATFEEFLHGCATGDTQKLKEYYNKNQYFNELTKETKPGIFVDMGAYDGDSVAAAEAFYGERISKFIAFEPEEENYVKLKKNVSKLGISDDRILAIQKGSWSSPTVLKFSEGLSTSSRVDDEGEISVQVDSLDNVLANSSENVSFIKMDVEGSELESIIGSEETIKKYHPIIAACVYHRLEDIYTIPLRIKEIAGEYPYRFYLRYHHNCLTELVVYAIPK